MVESTALEMRRAGNGTVGSNPTLSAMTTFAIVHLIPVCSFFEGGLFRWRPSTCIVIRPKPRYDVGKKVGTVRLLGLQRQR